MPLQSRQFKENAHDLVSKTDCKKENAHDLASKTDWKKGNAHDLVSKTGCKKENAHDLASRTQAKIIFSSSKTFYFCLRFHLLIERDSGKCIL